MNNYFKAYAHQRDPRIKQTELAWMRILVVMAANPHALFALGLKCGATMIPTVRQKMHTEISISDMPQHYPHTTSLCG